MFQMYPYYIIFWVNVHLLYLSIVYLLRNAARAGVIYENDQLERRAMAPARTVVAAAQSSQSVHSRGL